MKLKDNYYKDLDFFEKIFTDEINNMLNPKDHELRILSIFIFLLEIIKNLNNYNEFDIGYFECVNFIHKYYEKLEKHAHIVFQFWHRGMCYSPKNSESYIRLKKEIESHLHPVKENTTIKIGKCIEYVGNIYF